MVVTPVSEMRKRRLEEVRSLSKQMRKFRATDCSGLPVCVVSSGLEGEVVCMGGGSPPPVLNNYRGWEYETRFRGSLKGCVCGGGRENMLTHVARRQGEEFGGFPM